MLHCIRLVLSMLVTTALVGVPWLAISTSLQAADHLDTPTLTDSARHDARITDFFTFMREGHLVLVLCVDPTVPSSVTEYIFPSDVTYRFFIDNNSAVSFTDRADLQTYGGTILNPRLISEDIEIRVTFDANNRPRLRVATSSTTLAEKIALDQIKLFAGLRDDPYIHGSRIGRNVAAIVVEIPLEWVLNSAQNPLLTWSSTDVSTIAGMMEDLGGRALRSHFPENVLLNSTHPCKHASDLTMVPDVVIYNTKLPASFPNGRELFDDVVDLVGDPRATQGDAPFPAQNDVPLLDVFPYLATPHTL